MIFEINKPIRKNNKSYAMINPNQLIFFISFWIIWFVSIDPPISKGLIRGINNMGESISLPLTLENSKKVIVPIMLKPKFTIKTNIRKGISKRS